MNKWIYTLLWAILVISACRKPYQPPAITAANNFLVVEGNINGGTDSTFIKLSRTVNIDNKSVHNPESGALVNIQSNQNVSFPLTEIKSGIYACAGIMLDQNLKYRLSIKIVNGESYLSDFVPVLNSPPIDSITFDTNGSQITGPGINLYVNSHDPLNKIKYYRWDYQETWVFHANFHSYFYSNGDTVLARNLNTQNITNCWGSDTSSTIVLGSSAKLTSSVILKNPITSVISSSEKLGSEYSILVRQYALTVDAYAFYSNLKKNTEQLGSIFDAQPTFLTGNIHCVTNPSEPVIGYISAGNLTTKRIFINNRQLPTWETIPFYTDCKLEFDWDAKPPMPCCFYNFGGINQIDAYINYNIGHNPAPFIPIDALGQPGKPPVGYTAGTQACVDCTLRGTNKRPAFWQ